MPRRRVLAGAYASLTSRGGIALYGSAESLQNLADAIRANVSTDIGLPPPPEEVLEEGPVGTIRVLAGCGGPIELRTVGKTLEIAGGPGPRTKLSATLKSLANSPAFGGELPRHIDLEYFPGHGFLGEGSMWMTVTLLPA